MIRATLRQCLRNHVAALKDSATHERLPDIAATLGLPPLSDEGSKRARLTASVDCVADGELPGIAERLWTNFPLGSASRNELQDLAWATAQCPEIPKRFRRELAREFKSANDLFLHASNFEALLDRLWVLDDPLELIFGGGVSGLRAQIHQHVFRNPEDWSAEELFEQLGAFEASDKRFLLFLEGLAAADIRPDMNSQREFVQQVNSALEACGVELQECGTDGGYPVFRLTWKGRTPKGRPNLIFASPTKPDLRFRDAVSNDIEIVSGGESVLVYDLDIPAVDGLTWRNLQTWWAARGEQDQATAKKTLYLRLRSSLPDSSPPQSVLFESYYKHFGPAIPHLPALLPEVWLHWDPKTVRERGRHALLRFRMDFLLLLPNNVRVVIEVDGKQHYADDGGLANPKKYAAMAAADRELQLAGYEVYHFGGAELVGNVPHPTAVHFFEALFRAHHVTATR